MSCQCSGLINLAGIPLKVITKYRKYKRYSHKTQRTAYHFRLVLGSPKFDYLSEKSPALRLRENFTFEHR